MGIAALQPSYGLRYSIVSKQPVGWIGGESCNKSKKFFRRSPSRKRGPDHSSSHHRYRSQKFKIACQGIFRIRPESPTAEEHAQSNACLRWSAVRNQG